MKSEDLEKATRLFRVFTSFRQGAAVGIVEIEGITKARVMVKSCHAGGFARQLDRDGLEARGFYLTAREAADAYRRLCREKADAARAEFERAEEGLQTVDERGDLFSLDRA